MFKRLSPSWLVLALSLMFVPGCEDDEARCEPGEEIECSCDDGEDGTQYCLSNGRFDPCYCGGGDLDFTRARPRAPTEDPELEPFDAGRIDAGPLDAGRLDAGPDAGEVEGVLLASGPGRLIEMFAAGQDVWLVLPQRIQRISLLDGGAQADWTAPRPLTGAVFDGQRLVALDAAKLTLLDRSSLSELASSNLVEPCVAAALTEGVPLLCMSGSATLSAIEPADGGGAGSARANRGGKLIAVPGTRRVLAMDTSSSFAPQAFEVGLDGGVAAVGDGGAVTILPSGSSITSPIAFDAVPPQNLITRQGLLFRMNETCGSTAEPCFARTGTLGLLATQEVFLGLSTAEGRLFGLVDPNSGDSLSRPRCDQQPCTLMRVDVAARVARGRRTLRRPLRDVIAMQALPAEQALVLALNAVAPGPYYSSTADAGYQVVRLDLPAEE